MTKSEPELRQGPSLAFTLAGVSFPRPDEEIKQLFDALKPYGDVLSIPAKYKLAMTYKDEKVIYLLHKGYFSYRYHDTGMIISYLYPPLVIGLGNIFSHCSTGYHRAEVPTEVQRVTESNLYRCLENNPLLWQNITVILAYALFRTVAQSALVVPPKAYQVVRNLLIDLNQQPEEIKKTVSAPRYILDRAPLSRSTVMHIISELQRGGYVNTAWGGFLTGMSNLPENF